MAKSTSNPAEELPQGQPPSELPQGQPPSELPFEQAFEELSQLVARLEQGDLPLEESLALFERGQALAARCGALLEGAELKLRQLAGDQDAENQETEFDPDSPE